MTGRTLYRSHGIRIAIRQSAYHSHYAERLQWRRRCAFAPLYAVGEAATGRQGGLANAIDDDLR